MTKTTNELDVSTNSQPALPITQPRALPDALLNEVVLIIPQARNASATTALTPKTTLSTPPLSLRGASGSTSSAGCGMGSPAGDLNASSTASWTACAVGLPFLTGGRRRGVSGVVVMLCVPSMGRVPGHLGR